MSFTNSVFNVLVTSGNQAIKAAGNRVPSLAVGQIGVFNGNTKLSVAGSTKDRIFYLAVGVDKDGDTVVDDTQKSAGEYIQLENVTAYNVRCYTPEQAQIVEVTGFTAKCGEDYGLKVEFQNGETFGNYGSNNPYKSYIVRSNSCNDCDDPCTSGDCITLADNLITNINDDTEGLLTAVLLDGPGGAEITAAAFLIATPNACPTIQITVNASAVKTYCKKNWGYVSLRNMKINVSFVGEFVNDTAATITTTQEMIHEEGAGYDLIELEREAIGWREGGPFRQSGILGSEYDRGQTCSDEVETYNVITLHYELKTEHGWGQQGSSLQTLIAVPCGDNTAMSSILTALDAILTGRFEEIEGDVDTECACTVNTTSGMGGSSTDAISD